MSSGGNSLDKPGFLLDFKVWSKLWNSSLSWHVFPACETLGCWYCIMRECTRAPFRYLVWHWITYLSHKNLPWKLSTSGHKHVHTAQFKHMQSQWTWTGSIRRQLAHGTQFTMPEADVIQDGPVPATLSFKVMIYTHIFSVLGRTTGWHTFRNDAFLHFIPCLISSLT
jgi:hypothetical protein